MELRQLQCLVACADTKSFSKAANTLFTTQSNVSKMISALEGELGKKLFERRQFGIELTEKGRQVYKYALNMIECRDRILDVLEEEDFDELRVSFQPSSWFASAFCDFYLESGYQGKSYQIISATVDEIIRRLYQDMDQMGFAYIEEEQLLRLKDIFQKNHIGFYELKRTRSVLHLGGKNRSKEKKELLLVQGCEDSYAGISSWKDRVEDENDDLEARVVVTTNSDYVMKEMLERTELSNISPEYMSDSECAETDETQPLEGEGQTILYVCMFRNDRTLEPIAKQFLTFIRNRLQERI